MLTSPQRSVGRPCASGRSQFGPARGGQRSSGRSGSAPSGRSGRQAAGCPAGQSPRGGEGRSPLPLPSWPSGARYFGSGAASASSRPLLTGDPECGWAAAPLAVGAGAFLDVPVAGPRVSSCTAGPRVRRTPGWCGQGFLKGWRWKDFGPLRPPAPLPGIPSPAPSAVC